MNLAESTADIRAWTRRLHEALAEGGNDPQTLLAGREEAMTAFIAQHRTAPAAEQAACREELMALQSEDAALQELARELLGDADRLCRAALGASSAPASSYRDEPALACLDRRA